MAPNYYQSYNANVQNPSNPQQTYSGYHAQTSVAHQPSGQYQTSSTPSVPSASQTHDTYQGYQQYAQQTGYGGNQGYSWDSGYNTQQGNSTAGRAAEALSNMSMADHMRTSDNRSGASGQYASSDLGSTNGSGFNTTSGMSDRNINALAQYNQSSSNASQAHQTYTSHDSSRPSASHTSHAQRTSRPDSVSSASSGYAATAAQRQVPPRLPTPGAPSAGSSQYQSRRVQAVSNDHRSPSPAQVRASHNAQGATQRPANNPLAVQYADLGSRRLPSVSEAAYGSSTITGRQSYDRQTASHAQGYEQSAVTVDPAHVYDPWQEKLRQAELARKAKEVEEAAAAGRAAEEAERNRKAEEAKKAAEEARKAEEQRRAEATRKADEDRRVPEPAQQKSGQKQGKAKDAIKGKNGKPKAGSTAATSTSQNTSAAAPAAAPTADELEAQMRMVMANLREMNAKNPALLAKIWEEERALHARGTTGPPAAQPAQPQPIPAPQTAPQATMGTVQPGPSRNSAVNGHANGTASAPRPPQAPRQHQQQAPPSVPAAQTTAQSQPGQAPPAKSSTGGTAWPQEKKGELSAAAAKWLNAIPGNANNQIAPEAITRMLDSNPTYIDLCERLEGLGIKLERRTFAQALLKACPDVNNKSQNQRPPPPPGVRQLPAPSASAANRPAPPSKQTPQPPHGLPTPHPTDDYGPPPVDDGVYGALPAPGPTAVQSPYFTPQPPTSATPGAVAPIATMISSTSRLQPPRTPSSQPATKADAARKRDFNEIVDLTTISDDEPPLPPPKIARTGPEPMLAFQPPPSAVQQPGFIDPGLRQFGYAPNGIPLQPHVAPVPVPPQPAVFDELSTRTDLVRPIDRKKALRRSTYSLKTIARDILLATGKHPDVRALNAHLEPLKIGFRQVDDRSDLDTFRWDLVDPGEPPPGYYSNGAAEAEDADDEEDEPQPRARPHVMVRQAVGAGAAGGDSSAFVNSGPMDPAAAKPLFKRPRGRPPRHSDPGFRNRPLDFTNDGAPASGSPHHRQSSSSQGTGPGRPPPSNVGRDPQATPSARAPKATSSSASRAEGSGTGYSAFRVPEFGPDGSPLPKKRGRPVGWRKAIHGSAAAQTRVIDRSRPHQPSALRNVQAAAGVVDLSSSRSPSVREAVEYKVYRCRWRGCKAELHNLDTLCKHVVKIHGTRSGVSGGWECLWEGCGEQFTEVDEVTGEESVEQRPLEFEEVEGWKEHVEGRHLEEVAWRLGDGPAGGLSDAHDSDAYLSDRSGRRVTPQVVVPSDPSSGTPASAGASRGPGRPAKKTDEQKALEAQARLEKQKRDIGPGVDRGGARLANEKRRGGFVDDEEGEMEVDEA